MSEDGGKVDQQTVIHFYFYCSNKRCSKKPYSTILNSDEKKGAEGKRNGETEPVNFNLE
jgi:hypothetical protein